MIYNECISLCYNGAVYRRRDKGLDGAEPLYVCCGKDVGSKESNRCQGTVAFELVEKYGELLKPKIRLTKHSQHNHW